MNVINQSSAGKPKAMKIMYNNQEPKKHQQQQQ